MPVSCIILAAGHTPRLKYDIEKDKSGQYSNLQEVPKALLPGPKKVKVLDHWWRAIRKCEEVTQVFLVTNAHKYKYFERWASASNFPLGNVINNGSTLPTNALGAVSDLELVIRIKNLWDHDILVIAGDMIYQVDQFEPCDVLDYWKTKPDSDVAVYYNLLDTELCSTRGIMQVNDETCRVERFYEKPLPGLTKSRAASVVFYGLKSDTLQLLCPFMQERRHLLPATTLGNFMEHVINDNKREVYGYKASSVFQLIGDVSLLQYLTWVNYFSADSPAGHPIKVPGFTTRTYARVGLIGNPSDGFNGKTISMTIANFWADVTIEESATLRLVPHPLNDPTEFGSLNDLHGISTREGYLGGLRLLQATCKKFHHYCIKKSISLHSRNFSLSYTTNIPRQVGLAGSSAIVTSTLHALMVFYGLSDDDIPLMLRPQLILDVEIEELCISAGLQDRVVQVYEGLVYMDFAKEFLEKDGHGKYERVTLPQFTRLPPFFLVYKPESSDSGKMHSPVRSRWLQGDPVVVDGMTQMGHITDQSLKAIVSGQWDTLGSLMEQNFSIREQLYGRECLGESNMRMIELGRKHGASVKFPGSGGAVLGLVTQKTDMEGLRAAYQAEGCVVVDVIPRLHGPRVVITH